jgi:antitoxin VapB
MIYTIGIYHQGLQMAKTGTAKIFKHGRSQAVRLPKEFRFPGKEVRIRRVGRGVLLEPINRDWETMQAIFEKIDRSGGADFLAEGRPEQPPMPIDDRKYFDGE